MSLYCYDDLKHLGNYTEESKYKNNDCIVKLTILEQFKNVHKEQCCKPVYIGKKDIVKHRYITRYVKNCCLDVKHNLLGKTIKCSYCKNKDKCGAKSYFTIVNLEIVIDKNVNDEKYVHFDSIDQFKDNVFWNKLIFMNNDKDKIYKQYKEIYCKRGKPIKSLFNYI